MIWKNQQTNTTPTRISQGGMRVSPSGKAPPSQGGIRGFESHHPL